MIVTIKDGYLKIQKDFYSNTTINLNRVLKVLTNEDLSVLYIDVINKEGLKSTTNIYLHKVNPKLRKKIYDELKEYSIKNSNKLNSHYIPISHFDFNYSMGKLYITYGIKFKRTVIIVCPHILNYYTDGNKLIIKVKNKEGKETNLKINCEYATSEQKKSLLNYLDFQLDKEKL